jgi:hypothetical protein
MLPGFTPRAVSLPIREPAWLTIALTIAAAAGLAGVTGLHLARLRHASMRMGALLFVGGAMLALGTLWVYLRRGARPADVMPL